jgi:hypothetical protein
LLLGCVIALQTFPLCFPERKKSSQQISKTATETFHYYLSAKKYNNNIRTNLYKIMMAYLTEQEEEGLKNPGIKKVI